jgi:Protein of unknown function (DUF2690)
MKRFMSVLGAVLVSVGLLVVAADPAAAGSGYPPCLSACENQDPQYYQIYFDPNHPDHYYTCSADASTKTWLAVTSDATAELRYSSRCETTWGRFTRATGCCVTSFVDIITYSYYASGALRTAHRNSWGYGNWTLMLDDHGYYNKVCLEDFYNENDYNARIVHERSCTGLY